VQKEQTSKKQLNEKSFFFKVIIFLILRVLPTDRLVTAQITWFKIQLGYTKIGLAP
jgi:uncharacterized membrane protein YiaA